MKKPNLDLYTDYLLSTFGAATATGLSAMVEGDVSHDQVTRFLSGQEYTSKDLWQNVKKTVRSVECEDGVLIFDDTIQEKAWTDESELMCWHYDHWVRLFSATVFGPSFGQFDPIFRSPSPEWVAFGLGNALPTCYVPLLRDSAKSWIR